VETWETEEAGRHFQMLLDGTLRGDWQLVGHAGHAAAVLADVSELIDLLGGCYPFRPRANVADGVTELWLPEIGLHSSGPTLDEARLELAQAMLAYARAWAQQAAAAMGRIVSNGYARRILLAADADGVLRMIDRDATREAVPMRAAQPWTDADPDKPRRWMGPRDRIERVRAALDQEEGAGGGAAIDADA
jgi:hypothetical protein